MNISSLVLIFLSAYIASATVLQPKTPIAVIRDAGLISIDYRTEDGEYVMRREDALFGEGYVWYTSGVLVHVTAPDNVSDHTACTTELLGTNGNAIPSSNWIALVQRGDCSFEQKVQNALNFNAEAVIVYDDRDSNELIKMNTNPSLFITSLFTHRWVGEGFARVVDSGVNTYAYVGPKDDIVSGASELTAPLFGFMVLASIAASIGFFN